MPALGAIEGRVEGVSQGGPRTVNHVVAQRYEAAPGGRERFVGPFVVSASARDDGHFVLEHLLPGRYRVLAFVSERTSGPGGVAGERQVEAKAAVEVGADGQVASVVLRVDD